MVLHTCERMAAGAFMISSAAAFARYSVDAGWLVPHFEKMLYDNAQLAQLYLDASVISGALTDWRRRSLSRALVGRVPVPPGR